MIFVIQVGESALFLTPKFQQQSLLIFFSWLHIHKFKLYKRFFLKNEWFVIATQRILDRGQSEALEMGNKRLVMKG